MFENDHSRSIKDSHFTTLFLNAKALKFLSQVRVLLQSQLFSILAFSDPS